MKKPKRFGIGFVLMLLLTTSPSIHAQSTKATLDSLLVELDRTIERSEEYTAIKEDRISKLKLNLAHTEHVEERFQLYKEIFNEYEFFVCDSAYRYSKDLQSLAKAHHNVFWTNESELQISNTLNISGMYPEAIRVLDSLNRSTLDEGQLVKYYTGYYHTYNEWGEFAEYSYANRYKELGEVYRDSLLSL